MTLTLRYMRPSDVPAVVEIDALSFPDPWPLRSYMFEVNESRISHMCALVSDEAPPSSANPSLIDRLLRRKPAAPQSETIAAYGGLWCIAEEAHISTIAAHPRLRGRGYGEIVLAGMLLRALALQAEYAVLEVRVSNRIAQNLYQKYGFAVVDVTRRYYRDGEDAFLMRLELAQPDTIEALQNRYDQLQQRCPFNDEYSRVSHPRLGV